VCPHLFNEVRPIRELHVLGERPERSERTVLNVRDTNGDTRVIPDVLGEPRHGEYEVLVLFGARKKALDAFDLALHLLENESHADAGRERRFAERRVEIYLFRFTLVGGRSIFSVMVRVYFTPPRSAS